MARILLGVTGGIAAYKACTLTRLLVRAGHDVYPLVTEAAERFVRAETFFALARKSRSDDPYPHLERADLLVVAPLTANTLARLAHGLADDLLTEAALAHAGPVARRARDERAHVGAPGDSGERRPCFARAAWRSSGRRKGSSPRARSAWGGWSSRTRSRPAIAELLGARGERRRLARRIAGWSSRRVARASRSTPCVSRKSFVGPDGRGTRRGGPLAVEPTSRCSPRTSPLPAPAGVTVVETPTAADLEREALARADADIIVMAAAVADYRPPVALGDEAPEGRRALDGGARADDRRARRAGRTPRGRIRFSSDSPPTAAEHGLERAREKRRRQGRRPLRLQRRQPGGHRLRLARERGRRALGGRGACTSRRRRRGRSPLRSWTRWSGYSRSDERPGSGGMRRSSSAVAADVVAARRREPGARGAGTARNARALRPRPPRRGASDHRGLPGVGKTVLAKSLARSLDLSFSRLQFTPDLLPTDVTGVNVFNQRTNEFEFRPGPVFTNVLLVDEINRASPKTQSALLEAMQESPGDDRRRDVRARAAVSRGRDPEPDRVRGDVSAARGSARPLHGHAVARIPAARRGGADARRADDRPSARPARAVAGREDVLMAIEAARGVYVEESVNRYVVALLAHTRRELEARARGKPARRHRAPAHGQGSSGRRRPGLRPAGGRPGGRGRRLSAPGDRRARGAGRRSPARRRCRRRSAETRVPA